jgi:hypothetical protein
METKNNSKRKLKRTLLIIAGAIVLFVILVILFISPLTKYLIEKYDEKYTGRKITLDWAYVNLFTGYLHFSNLKFYEQKERSAATERLFGKAAQPGDSIFLSMNGLSINFEMLKLLSKTYEVSKITFDSPKGIIIQSDKDFNFSDLIEKFNPKKKVDSLKEATHFNILDIKIKNGEFHYRENGTPIDYFVKKVDFESDGKRWNVDTIAGKLSLSSGIGSGDLKSNFTINTNNNDYRLMLTLKKFDMNIIEQYLQDLTNYGTLSAFIDADFKSKGNIKDRTDVTNSGQLTVSDFHFGKNPKEDYVSFAKLDISIKEVSPSKFIYSFDSLALTDPYLKYERYDSLDNLQTMFGVKGSNVKAANANPDKFNLVIEIANYIKDIGRNLLRSNYKVDRVAIYKGNLKFNDYKLSEKFSASLNPLYLIVDSIDKKYDHVDVSLKSGIKPYGNLAVNININPKDSSDFDLHFGINKVPTTLFNPYSISYTSFPLNRGTIEINGNWRVRNGTINSMNHIILIDPRLSTKQKINDAKWIPMRLVMFFIRERGNVIDYEVPITGNLKDPKFNFWDVILDVIKNIFVKPPTTPYRLEVRSVERKIEKSFKIHWEMRTDKIAPHQEKFLEEIAGFLKKTPDAQIEIKPMIYETKEKEYILLFETKKKYFLDTHGKNGESLSEKDKEEINKISVKDPPFTRYLNKHVKDTRLFTVQEKCYRIIGTDRVDKKYKELNKERETLFLNYFKERGVEKQIKIAGVQNTIPFNGFSYFKIEYKGEFPESLIKAYHKMDELDNKPPRDKYKDDRKKNGNTP